MTHLAGKVVICAGSGTGIGAEAARRLASDGARVVIGDIGIEAAHSVVDTIASEGGDAIAHQFDITDEVSVNALIGAAVSHFGGLDLIHVNATDRRFNQRDMDALTTDLEVFDRLISVSLRGHLLCTRAAIPEMLKRGGGAIVYTSSEAGRLPASVRMSYGVAKAGLNALMRHVAYQWGPQGIRANAVSPGPIVTDAMLNNTTEVEREVMVSTLRHTRLGEPRDIASLVSFLLSDDGEWINGQTICINGGKAMAL